MQVTVTPLLRRGARIPGSDPTRSVAGELRMAQVWDEVRKRWVGEMSIVSSDLGGRPVNLLAPIYEPQLVAIGGQGMTVAGFERIGADTGRADVAQSWWVRLGS